MLDSATDHSSSSKFYINSSKPLAHATEVALEPGSESL